MALLLTRDYLKFKAWQGYAERFSPGQYENRHLTILMQSLLQPDQDKTKKPVQPYYLAYLS